MNWFMLDLDNEIAPVKSVGVVTYLGMKSQWLSVSARPEEFDTKN
jgi:hypothetical protein